MSKEEIIFATELYVKKYMEDKEAGHNWWHIYRVRNNAKYILSKEGRGDSFIIELSALLHDIGDDKIDAENDGIGLVRSFLSNIGLGDNVIDPVTEIMSKISFRDSFKSTYSRSIELDIVQDADRLDAIGAIGIARAFAYGGTKGNEIYKPETGPRIYKSKQEYTSSDSSTINHFYEKLLLLKGMMNTETGKKLAEDRHSYMEEFLARFMSEWNINSKG
jgi:uncharacterized protein